MATSRLGQSRLYSLPNEVSYPEISVVCEFDVSKLLMQILKFFPSQHLLLLGAVSRRFHDIAAHIVYGRLVVATSLQDHKLILECYHPTNQYTEPFVFCESISAPGRSDETSSPALRGKVGGEDDCFRKIATLYSRFKPFQANAESKPARPCSAGSNPVAQNMADPSINTLIPCPEDEDELMTRTVNLDNDELFSQLCLSIALLQVDPRHGMILGCIEILRKRTARIWRQWLLENSSDSADGEPERIIWIDQGQNVGLKVKVQEIKGKHRAPILQLIDDNQPISYKLGLEGRCLMFLSDY